MLMESFNWLVPECTDLPSHAEFEAVFEWAEINKPKMIVEAFQFPRPWEVT
jgi:hypothetical protein